MPTEIAKLVLDVLKLAPRYLIALGVIAGFLLFADDNIVQTIGLTEIIKKYRSAFGLVLVGSSGLFIVSLAADALNFYKKFRNKGKARNRITSRLAQLTEDEKQILRYYLANNTRANYLRVDDGTVQGLASAGIIYRSAKIGDIIDGFAYNIGDFAWDYLHTYPQLLEGHTDTYRTDKRIGRY